MDMKDAWYICNGLRLIYVYEILKTNFFFKAKHFLGKNLYGKRKIHINQLIILKLYITHTDKIKFIFSYVAAKYETF